MTDNEITKALECCTNEGFQDCENCPLNKPHQPCKKTLLPQITLNLVNRQKAEIEALNKENKRLKDKYEIVFQPKAMIKAEAIKEFAERFENEFDKIEEFYFEEEHENFVSANKVLAFLDNLVKEMVGED